MALEQQSTITEEWHDCHSKKIPLNQPGYDGQKMTRLAHSSIKTVNLKFLQGRLFAYSCKKGFNDYTKSWQNIDQKFLTWTTQEH